MTIGRNNEAPAAYALSSTIKRLLDHLAEANLYSAKDLEHIFHTLENLGEIVGSAHSYSPMLVTLLSNRLKVCAEQCESLLHQLHRLDPQLADVHEKLISVLRSISLANTRSKVCQYYYEQTFAVIGEHN